MVNYLFGKIYKIVGNGNVYIGSTCQLLDVRLRAALLEIVGSLRSRRLAPSR